MSLHDYYHANSSDYIDYAKPKNMSDVIEILENVKSDLYDNDQPEHGAMIEGALGYLQSDIGTVNVWADGACSGNPGPGGWGYVVQYQGGETDRYRGSSLTETTNNKMELMAIMEALIDLGQRGFSRIIMHTDSELAIGWLTGQFKRKNEQIIEYCEMIEEVIDTYDLDVTYKKSKGHSGEEYNEIADKLARSAIRK
jgi:ribonuclease HI